MAKLSDMVTIRTAAADDAEGIARVHVASWRSTYRGLLPDDVLERLSVEQRKHHWHDVLNGQSNARVVLVTSAENGQIVGFASGGTQRDEALDFDGELYAIYLLEEFQRQGIGRALIINFAEQLAKTGYKKMQVWVMEGNAAQDFYKSMGGEYITSKTVNIGGTDVVERAYGWQSIDDVIRHSH